MRQATLGAVSTPDVRASDADRESAADRLREHTAAGRLTPEELSDRLDTVYAARTTGEIESQLADLPAPLPAAPSLRTVAAKRVRVAAAVSLTPFLVCNVIWLASGMHGSYWPVWLLIPFVAQLMSALRPLLAGEDPERYDARRRERHERRERHREEHRRRALGPPPPPPEP